MRVFYIADQLGKIIAKNLTKAQLDTLLPLLSCNINNNNLIGVVGMAGLTDAATLTVHEDEVAYVFSDSVEDSYGWSINTKITDKDYNVLSDYTHGDWTLETPDAIVEPGKGRPICRSLIQFAPKPTQA